MFLRQKNSKHLVEVLDLNALFDPHKSEFRGRFNVGEEMPEAESFVKSEVCFPSSESLPRCWLDAHYRDEELRHSA